MNKSEAIVKGFLRKFYNEIWSTCLFFLNAILFWTWIKIEIDPIKKEMLFFSMILLMLSAFNFVVSRMGFEIIWTLFFKKPSMKKFKIFNILNLVFNILLSIFSFINVNLTAFILLINKGF